MAKMLIRRAIYSIRDHNFEWKSEKIKVEVSCGIAAAGELGHEDGTEDLIAIADSRLYHAKRSQEPYSITVDERYPVSAAV
jgi:GGDEF domain-containing protein